MADKLIHIPNGNTLNYPFCRLRSVVGTFGHSTEWTNQNLIKVSKVEPS